MGILLEPHNRIIYETLLDRFNTPPDFKPESVDSTLADFDGVMYHMSNPSGNRLIVRVSLSLKSYSACLRHGAAEIMRLEYGNRLVDIPENGFDVSVDFALDSLPPSAAEREKLALSAALIKRNALSAPFEKAFDAQIASQSLDYLVIPYGDETIFIGAQSDRVTVIFQTFFKEDMDKVFGKVFLQEFVDARKQISIQTAPQVLFTSKDPPLELRGLAGIKDTDDTGYVTFVLTPRHFETKEKRHECVSRIQLFRDYLHYHIKCSKAYMHSRMRARVDQFLKILNRAKPEVPEHLKERKTATGKTFTQRR